MRVKDPCLHLLNQDVGMIEPNKQTNKQTHGEQLHGMQCADDEKRAVFKKFDDTVIFLRRLR